LTHDPVTLEPLTPGEQAATDSLIARMQAMMAHEWAGTTMRRDAHTKMHGVMKAEFTVERDLAPELRVGLFAQPATYRAWVRFSNSVNVIKPDDARDIRGMAIKLMGVPGRKLLPGLEDATTQDFIVISTDQFPIRDAAGFDALAAAFIGDFIDKIVYFATHLDVAWRLLKSFRKFPDLLQIRYFSCTPYAFGKAQVKYCATPHVAQPDAMPFDPPENYLRQRAVAQLARGDAVFDFCVQFRTDPEDMPTEDPTVVWDEAESPFRKVATLRLLAQDFDTDAQNAVGENLSFSPWHCLPAHMPLGGLNRVRRIIYEALSKYRHGVNQVPRREPTDWET
jgi:catalase